MKKRIFLAFVILLLLALTGCSINEEKSSNEKITQEISYIDKKIISILNDLNNISLENYKIERTEISLTEETSSGGESQGENKKAGSSNSEEQQNKKQNNNIVATELSDTNILTTSNNEIEWNRIKKDIELVSMSWNSALMDLYNKKEISNEIQVFSNDLNNSIIAIKNEDKLGSIIALSKLYGNLPKFVDNISEDKRLANIKQTKYYIISGYALVNQSNWQGASEEIKKAESEFLNVMNDIEYTQDKESKINSIYINIKEMQNGLKKEDPNLFIMNYKNLIKEINKL